MWPKSRATPFSDEQLQPSERGTRGPCTSGSQILSRPLSSRPTRTSRRRSTASTLSICPTSCSRSSSFLICQPPRSYHSRSRLPYRRSSVAHSWTNSHDSTNHHSNPGQVFQSLDIPREDIMDLYTSRPRARSTSSPTLLHSSMIATERSSSSTLVEMGRPQPQSQRAYSNYVPATTIDWTLPSTRQRQYEYIDRSTRGLRGLVRRMTSRLSRQRSNASQFYDEKGSDAGTVRRYRLDVDDRDSDVDEEEEEAKIEKHGEARVSVTNGTGTEQQEKEAMKEMRTGWNCLRLRGSKG